ncbi:unnamed protein product [Rotaria magnacalcarata]
MQNRQQEQDEKMYETRQIIECCIRSLSTENDKIVRGEISSISTFDQLKKQKFFLTFSNIVGVTFELKLYPNPNTTTTCYIHMKCDRGSPLLYPDWREICDGKTDCFGGGEDEKYCLELHINQCAHNESARIAMHS